MTLKSKLGRVDIPDHVSLTDFVLNKARCFGDKVALVDGLTGRRYTYKQFDNCVQRVASGLHRHGLKKGDVLAVLLPNSIDYPIIVHGAMKAGGTVTTMNPLYTSGEIERQLSGSGAFYVVTSPNNVDKVEEAITQCGNVKKIFVLGNAEGYTSVSTLMKDDGSALPYIAFRPKEDLAMLPFSSGTTGKSKGVMLTHYNIVANTCQVSHSAVDNTCEGQETYLVIVPFFHIYGITLFLSFGLHKGLQMVVFPRFDLKAYLEAAEKYRATTLHLVPPLCLLLSTHPLVDKYDMTSVHTIYTAAAPLRKEQADRLLARFHWCSLKQGYGMTEASPATHVTLNDSKVDGSIGVLLPNTECKVVDIETGKILSAHEDGELCMRGPQIMKGYLNAPNATSITIDKDGFLHSGDIGHFDEDENFYYVDRLKELIKYKGFQVAPAELESLLLTHPCVSDVAAIGVPNEEAGELPRAYIVPKSGMPISAVQIMSFVESKVAPHKKLRGGVVFLDEIPKSPTGKILRRVLKERLQTNMAKL